MGVLKNIKHEKFAQGIALRMSQDAAYVDAGYKATPSAAKAASSRLLKNVNVAARVKELSEGAAKRSARNLDEVIAQYESVAFVDLSNYLTVSPDGSVRYDLSKCDKKALTLLDIEEVKRTVTKPSPKSVTDDDINEDEATEVIQTSIKPRDRMKALDKLGAHLGMGDKAANQATDRLADAIRSISAKGSAAPMRKAKVMPK